MISNNVYNKEVIVSYDPDKIWEEVVNGKRAVCKKTALVELKNLLKMKKALLNKELCLKNCKYKLKVPDIYQWNNKQKKLYMEFCEGKNLEFYLRNKSTYPEGKQLLNELLNFFLQNKIYWLDFAARNIIIGKNEIYFVDFEKGFARKNIKVRDFLRNHVYEEYCIFLFSEDRIYSINEILELKNEKNKNLNLKDINCKRCVKIAQKLGYKNKIKKSIYLEIIRMLIVAQEPKIVNNKYYFPCVDLDKIFTNKKDSLDKYCNNIIYLYEKNNNKKSLYECN